MRSWPAVAAFALLSPLAGADKLTFDDRVELTRGLTAEFATVKQFLPRSRKPLPFEATGTWDKKEWEEIGKKFGPAARVGDQVQVSKISIEDDRLVLEINGGMKGRRKWYQGIEIGMGNSTTPVANGNSNAPSGTSIAVLFHKPLVPIKASEVKKMLAPVLDFEKHSVTEVYSETLKPEVRAAIAGKKAIEGMDREQVVMAMGRPEHKSRETRDGMELEDWVYGRPPGRITFVTFNGNKVVKVKEAYAGLGTEVADQPTPR